MALLDHFHPPLSLARHWEAFHAAWATTIAERLNELLPAGYVAEPQVHHGPQVEIDVAAFEQGVPDAVEPEIVRPAAVYRPQAPTASIQACYPDTFEVQVLRTRGGPTLVAAIELVSPRNKDRDSARELFVAKCVAYLGQGISLAVVDLVTDRRARLHEEIVGRLDPGRGGRLPEQADLWAASYQPVRVAEQERIRIWLEALALGDPLPEGLPLYVDAATALPLELERTYADTCRRLKIDVERLSRA